MQYLKTKDIQDDRSTIHNKIRVSMPDNLMLYGWSSFSQCDEDGIIRECLSRISAQTPLSNTFLEIGCGNGTENNTHQLILDGFRGVWVDGCSTNIAFLSKQLGRLNYDKLLILESFITKDSIFNLIEKMCSLINPITLDLLSLDIDGNDYHILIQLLKNFKPKLICVEYNAKFPPPTKCIMAYNAAHTWGIDDYYGASLQSWVDLLEDYFLVCCNISGVNAFFVRKDLRENFSIYSPLEIYQPARYELIKAPYGHKSSLKWLKQALE